MCDLACDMWLGMWRGVAWHMIAWCGVAHGLVCGSKCEEWRGVACSSRCGVECGVWFSI